MVFTPLVDIWHEIVALKPGFLSRNPRFNFITVHYFWIIGLTMIGSILMYPIKNMDYIDALFFASGASTQAGLNTVDVNLLTIYQQLILFFMPMLTNPITINTFVVFLRLYWFEKRFQRIVAEARRTRGTISKSRSQMKGERDIVNEEAGVNGRAIVVMHNTTSASGITDGSAQVNSEDIDTMNPDSPREKTYSATPGISEDSIKGKSTGTYEPKDDTQPTIQLPQIKFAEKVIRSDGVSDEPLQRLPQWTEQDHIAVLERQRNPQDKGVLRIPGPRDAERGMAPEALDEVQVAISRRNSAVASRRGSRSGIPPQVLSDTSNGGPITINEPEGDRILERARAAAHTLGVFKFRKPRLFTSTKRSEESHHPSYKRPRASSFTSFGQATNRERIDQAPYLSWQPVIGRNSAFVDLTGAQREELGGIEYRSLKSLALILVLYFWGFTALGVICLTPWIIRTEPWGSIVDGDGINRVWWAFFTTNTAFNDVGFTLTPDSMNSFQTAIFPLLLMSFLVIIGNTGFPIMLRGVIWLLSKYVPVGSGIWEELKFLLDHPRRCFTLLFPSKATWWLFWVLVILNGIDLVFFVVLDIGGDVNPVTFLPLNIRWLDGWFQAVSTRTAGLSCVNIAQLHPAIQVSYMIMMYISVLPIAISVRRTNVYEERSLGIYGPQDEDQDNEGEPSYIGTHVRRQLSFDLWFIFLGFFIVAIAEGKKLQDAAENNDTSFTMFAILFEIVSAYGTVGLSLGYPTINASLSAKFTTVSKLVIIAMQIRGRHRGLPYELDRAILLPSESMHEKEDHDAAVRLRRRSSGAAMSVDITGLERINNSNMHDIGRGRSREKTQHPSLLSRIMYPGPSIPREYH